MGLLFVLPWLQAAFVAPDPRSHGISLAEARAVAERVAADVLVAERRSDVARAEIGVAGTLANPTLTLLTSRLTPQLSTGISVPLPLFGQRGVAVRAAEAGFEVSRLDREVVRNEVRFAATMAWIDLWEAQERARVLALAAKETDTLLGIAKARFDAGSAPRLDVVRASADRVRAAAEASGAAANSAAAAARLLPWLGKEQDEEPGAIEARGEPLTLPLVLPPLGAIVAQAAIHPVLRKDRAESAAAEAQTRVAERERWPVINGQVTVNQGDPTLDSRTDVIAGASFDLPVLSLHRGAIARARAQRAVTDEQAAGDARRLSADLRDAYLRTAGGTARERALRTEVLPSMEEARRMTEEGYRAGRVDLVRLLDAQRAVLDARLAQTEALATLARAHGDLERAIGHAP